MQSSHVFHTLEEARGYQTLNGGTLNIITKESEKSTVEIVNICPDHNMNKNEPGNLDNHTKRLRNEATHHINNCIIIYVKGGFTTSFEDFY